jgi:hypothetical protein
LPEEEEENRRAAIDLAGDALSVAADDPGVLGRAAIHRGRLDEARSILKRLLALTPVVVPTNESVPRPRASRTIPVGPAAGGGGGGMNIAAAVITVDAACA